MRSDKIGNGTGRQKVADYHPEKQQERAQNLKFAIFFLAVGVLLFVGIQFAKQSPADGSQPNVFSAVRLELSVGRKPESTETRNRTAEAAAYAVRFRLTNRGNQSIFYPAYQGTNRHVGRLVYRVAPRSEWMVLPWPKELTSISAGTSARGEVAWVEMPPDGWIEGIYDDPGPPGVDHAFQLDLKVTADGNVVRFMSQAYQVGAH